MPEENVFERVSDPADPRRCQSIGGEGQCPFKAVEGSKYCPRHGGHLSADSVTTIQQKESQRKYLSALYSQHIARQADHPEIKNLSEEIGILRMMLGKRLDDCKDDMQLLMAGSAILSYVREISQIVDRWHKIEMQTNQVMDKAQALDFIQALGEIIGTEINKLIPEQSSEALRAISEKMIMELHRRTNYQLKTKST